MRPGMYIGSTSKEGLHHLVWEIVDNSIDEPWQDLLAIFKSLLSQIIRLQLLMMDVVSQSIFRKNRSTCRWRLSLLFFHAGGKFGGGGYKVSGGLHGVGSQLLTPFPLN